MSKNTVLEAIKEHDAKLIDLRFTDIRGKEQHITMPVSAVDNDFVENGKMIDGSSFKGWQKIHQSDLALMPDLQTIKPDPFFQDNTLFIRCNVVDPKTMMGYERCPRSLALRAEAYLQSTGIADTALFGPEPEFFVFDSVQWETTIGGSFYKIDSEEAQWFSGKELEGGNTGHRPSIKGGYFPVPPVDSSHDMRSAMSLTLESLGIVVEAHHHEVATANQCEIATRFNTLTKKADELQILKYVVHNIAHNYGKTATFMPKPLVGDNGSGMHCHQSLVKDGVNLFSGDQYGGLSETALYYIGGIIKHARALNAFTNPSTNSYKRLVPGFEAPVLLAYSARNRSAAIRIPHVNNPKARRIEVRFPDPTANPYLAFAAMMMAGLDGIQRKIHPGQAMDKDLYDLPPEELVDVPTVCASLEQSMEHLQMDHDFLLQGDVFSQDFINNYISMKEEEISKIRSLTHPYEFELYYSL
ncbi:type I glutamate--ammonia ligase [Fluoribacter gormanii]|uniref:Glutamine synthetase n=1 Tax=Fluoribacter gormanii TaxID=464 RepID=A0A377GJH9_9GAMM|nr:type I glutamate--ammonia ligase [Fluoribacter gormanii]KTD00829.1 glutamine synthetase [Fluoribacter gormanii]MCW8443476.1 type I glutamate--ammonia ligase [Fluoribacter gormanii]MCW8471904.1 type I glutamate--ammonia ligase [Fluoribacter gormanii]SIQ79099.1 L-glutamine synthetase [Fluoribacter gormanii]STO24976.1 Glutamine synthetase [Fluoribacter gormanii]